MARVGLADVNSLPDPLQQYQAEFYIPSVPGAGDGKGLRTRCRSFPIPGEQKDEVEVTLHGITLKYAGRTMYGHDLQLTFIETRDVYVMTKLKAWLAYSRDIINTAGTYKSQYATSGFVYLYDDTEQVVATIKLFNCFIKTMDDVSLDGTSSTPIEVNATISYDWNQLIQGYST